MNAETAAKKAQEARAAQEERRKETTKEYESDSYFERFLPIIQGSIREAAYAGLDWVSVENTYRTGINSKRITSALIQDGFSVHRHDQIDTTTIRWGSHGKPKLDTPSDAE